MYLKELNIGNVKCKNNIFLAPMAGITDLPFRLICEKFEPGLVVTEMVSSKALLYNDEKTKKLLNVDGEKRPISMQIFGSDEEAMAYGAKYVSSLADIVDINIGCPAPKVTKNGDGSKLLLDLDKAGEVAADHKEVLLVEIRQQRIGNLLKLVPTLCSNHDRHNGRHLLEMLLQQRQLHLEAMLLAVRTLVTGEHIARRDDLQRKFGIDLHIAQRCIVGIKFRIDRSLVEIDMMTGP